MKKIVCFWLLISMALMAQGFSASQDTETPPQNPADSRKSSENGMKEYHYGTWIYYSETPVTVEYHLKHVAENISQSLHWLFEYGWDARQLQEELLTLSQEDEQYAAIEDQIAEKFQEVKRLSQCYYDDLRINIVEYVDPRTMPKDLAWELAKILALYANAKKDLALCKGGESIDHTSVVKFQMLSLLYFSYALGVSDSAPSILQYNDLEGMVSEPEFNGQVDALFQDLSQAIDQSLWLDKLQTLSHRSFDHLASLLRSMYHHFFHNRDALPTHFVSIAAHLNSITAKAMLLAQKNVNINIDAINPWMFKLYIDFKKWESLQLQDTALAISNLQSLLPEIEKRCLQLLPSKFTLENIAEENEFSICQEVRMRNLLPSTHGNLDSGKEIVDEFEFSPVAMRWNFIYTLYFLDEVARYTRGYHINVKDMWCVTHQIYNYLSGYVEIQDLPITQENALEYLMEIKVFDMLTDVWNSHYHVDYEYYGGMYFGFIGFGEFYFQRTSYELRKHILKLCPHLASYEALTVSVNPEKLSDEKEEITPDGWMEESEAIRQACVADLRDSAKYLAEMMNQPGSSLNGIIVGARGISGAGKSTFLKRKVLPLLFPVGEGSAAEIDALEKGILNPDTLKAAIKKLQGDTLNTQVHNEGIVAFDKLFREIADSGSYILDRRLLTPYDIMTDLIGPAKKSGSSVWLFDLDIQLATCITRILARPLHGVEPCPEYQALIDGYRAARRYRAQVTELAAREDAVARYELYATSNQRLIAHIGREGPCSEGALSHGPLCIHDEALFSECLREPTVQEIEEELACVIDVSFIDQAIAKGWIAPSQRELLEPWLGMTLKESIQRHVQSSKDSLDESLFEAPAVSSFKGQDWLGDNPQLLAFIQSEHLLHVRGADDSGRGLHWEAGQLERGLNPKYDPEASAPGESCPGIQMKIGYFIVPMDQLDLYLSKKLSPTVARELTVRDENGELFGLRFFVHPEAYAHFAPLLKEGLTFVPPSKSEFMGTPTSHYNSWLIRNISIGNRAPFIVKMGTPNGQSDIRHLFAGDEIVRSILYQKHIDSLPEMPDLALFKETAGLILKNIPGYPKGTVDSGIVIAELPEPLLNGECTALSLSALTSCERAKPENAGLFSIGEDPSETKRLPLIYELMEAAIQKGLVKSPDEFLRRYFIDAYFAAIEPLVLQEGYSLSGQNLYLLIKTDKTIKGFAYRDLKGMRLKTGYLESYSWSYRYAIFIKLLNVLTQSENEDLPPPFGAPIRAGSESASSERSLYHYLFQRFFEAGDAEQLAALKNFSLTFEERQQLLFQLDAAYLEHLMRYFAFDEREILNTDGSVPCAERGSNAAKGLAEKNRLLWKARIAH